MIAFAGAARRKRTKHTANEIVLNAKIGITHILQGVCGCQHIPVNPAAGVQSCKGMGTAACGETKVPHPADNSCSAELMVASYKGGKTVSAQFVFSFMLNKCPHGVACLLPGEVG